jgi:hypothetical protein
MLKEQKYITDINLYDIIDKYRYKMAIIINNEKLANG